MKPANQGCKPDKDKVWTKFHKVRSTDTFYQKWHKFLEHNNMPKDPIFYQHLTVEVFEGLLKASIPLTVHRRVYDDHSVTQVQT